MKKQKTRVVLALTALTLSIALSACGHEHEWEEATCTSPKTCVICEETEGESSEHEWKAATCTTPKTCSICGKSKGETLDHKWKAATCTTPKECSFCGETQGEVLEHEWQEATCYAPRNCSVCGKTEGEKTEHELNNEGQCKDCGEQIGIAFNDLNYKDYFTVSKENYSDLSGYTRIWTLKEPDKYEVGWGYYRAEIIGYSGSSSKSFGYVSAYAGKDGLRCEVEVPLRNYNNYSNGKWIYERYTDIEGYLLMK